MRNVKRTNDYVATFPNTPEGQAAYQFLVKSNRGQGKRLVKIYRLRNSGKPSFAARYGGRKYDGNIQKVLADRFDVYRHPVRNRFVVTI